MSWADVGHILVGAGSTVRIDSPSRPSMFDGYVPGSDEGPRPGHLQISITLMEH